MAGARDQRPLDPVYQDAESTHAANMEVIRLASIATRAPKSWGRVLRWYYEHGAHQQQVIAPPRAIAGWYWTDASERTVQRANRHWEKVGALTFQGRQTDNGAQQPPWATLNWSTVVQLSRAQQTGAVRELVTTHRVTESRRVSASERDGSFYLAGGDTPLSPPPMPIVTTPGDLSPPPVTCHHPRSSLSPPPIAQPYTAETPTGWHSPREVLACARAVCSFNCKTFDVVQWQLKNGGVVTRSDVARLADEAGGLIWRQGAPHEAQAVLYAAAAAALVLFTPEWLTISAETVGREHRERLDSPKRIRKPAQYLLGILRINLSRVAQVGPFTSVEDGRDALAMLLAPFERVTRPWLPPPPPEPEPAAAAPSSPARPSEEERAAAEERLRLGRAEKLRRVRGEASEPPEAGS